MIKINLLLRKHFPDNFELMKFKVCFPHEIYNKRKYIMKIYHQLKIFIVP